MRKLNLTLTVVVFTITLLIGLLINPNASGEGIKNDIVLYDDKLIQDLEYRLSERSKITSRFDYFDFNKVEYKKENEIVEKVKIELEVLLESQVEKTSRKVAEDSYSSSIEGVKAYYTLTAYTAGYESTGKTPSHPEYGITASGTYVKEGRTIACPKTMDFGTQVYIPSLDNTYTCEDVGGAIKSGKLDIYIENLNEALEFGRKKNVEVYILDEV